MTANTSVIWQHAAHTTDQLTSPNCKTGAIQKSLSLNEKYWRIFWKKFRRKDQQAEKDKIERVTGLGRGTRKEIAKWNQMTALRFQTGGRHQPSPVSLRWSFFDTILQTLLRWDCHFISASIVRPRTRCSRTCSMSVFSRVSLSWRELGWCFWGVAITRRFVIAGRIIIKLEPHLSATPLRLS